MRKADIEAIKDIIYIQQKEHSSGMPNTGFTPHADGYVQACEDIKDKLAEHFVDWED